MYPDLQYHAVPEVVEKHHVSNGSAVKLEGCFQDDAGGRATGHSRKITSVGKHMMALVGNVL